MDHLFLLFLFFFFFFFPFLSSIYKLRIFQRPLPFYTTLVESAGVSLLRSAGLFGIHWLGSAVPRHFVFLF